MLKRSDLASSQCMNTKILEINDWKGLDWSKITNGLN